MACAASLPRSPSARMPQSCLDQGEEDDRSKLAAEEPGRSGGGDEYQRMGPTKTGRKHGNSLHYWGITMSISSREGDEIGLL